MTNPDAVQREPAVPQALLSSSLDNREFERAARARGLQVRLVGNGRLRVSNGARVYTFKKGGCSANRSGKKLLNFKQATRGLVTSLGGRMVEAALCQRDEKEKAVAFARFYGWPVVVKPDRGRKGDKVFVGLDSESALLEAFENVAEKYPAVLVEEQFVPATEYRFYVAGGKVLAINRRVPANVVGDGVNNVAALVKIKNSLRKRRGFSKYPKIVLDEEVDRVLAASGKTLGYIPAKNEVLELRFTSNISTGGDSVDFLDAVHPGYKVAVERVAERLPGVFLCGFDVFIKDISAPPSRDNWAVCEVNPSPGIRMHLYPWQGTPRDVASRVMDLLFSSEARDSASGLMSLPVVGHNLLSLRKGAKKLRALGGDVRSGTQAKNSETYRVIVRGRVTGVGFRRWVRRKARGLGVSGWVRNRSDGSVEALLSGPRVERLLLLLHRGPKRARVASVEVRRDRAAPSRGMRIRRTAEVSLRPRTLSFLLRGAVAMAAKRLGLSTARKGGGERGVRAP